MSKYTIFQRENGKYYFILQSPSGRVLMTSEDSDNFIFVMNDIALLQRWATTETIFYQEKEVK